MASRPGVAGSRDAHHACGLLPAHRHWKSIAGVAVIVQWRSPWDNLAPLHGAIELSEMLSATLPLSGVAYSVLCPIPVTSTLSTELCSCSGCCVCAVSGKGTAAGSVSRARVPVLRQAERCRFSYTEDLCTST
eukprot:365967-Chlamydomonas_euryale.AAC.1